MKQSGCSPARVPVCTHVLCLQVSMASAMGSWCVTVAPLMYWAILAATSNWSGRNRKIHNIHSQILTNVPAEIIYPRCDVTVPVCGGSERLNTSRHAPSRKEEL